MANKKQIAQVSKWWRLHKNIWEISQLTGIPEKIVAEIVHNL